MASIELAAWQGGFSRENNQVSLQKDRYIDLRGRLATCGLESDVDISTQEEVDELRRRYEGIPEDYTDFLREVGHGSLAEDTVMLFSAPTSDVTLFGSDINLIENHLLAFGHDLIGVVAAFAPLEEWKVVEISPATKQRVAEFKSFEDFIQSRLRI